jgi:hypothetical protein
LKERAGVAAAVVRQEGLAIKFSTQEATQICN